MIKKIILCCSLILCASATYSQVTSTDTAGKTIDTTKTLKRSAAGFTTNTVTPPGGNSINTPSLTNVLPAAPNAFELTRYSGLPVNMSTGSVSAKIPLGNVKSGKVDVPIQLAYNSGNGILINQTASRAGMNWTLEAGGVITRSVRGNPDELSSWLTAPANFNDGSQATYNYLSYAQGNVNKDTQVDLFSFNFNGYSGQFYLSTSDTTASGFRVKAVMVEQNNLKVETNFHNEFGTTNWTIRITDPQGTKYYFGGPNATETSKTSPFGGGCGKNFNIPWATAWYLIAVQHYTGEYVWFDYKPVQYDYFTDVSQTMIRTPGTGAGWACGAACPVRTEDQICYSQLQSSGVILKSISSKFVKVNFKYAIRADLPGDSILTSVEFWNKGLIDTTRASYSLFNTYSLNYTDGSNTSYYNNFGDGIFKHRPFLTSVVRTATGIQTQTHTMRYYNMNGIASRLSFAQDYWGYFNGVNNFNLVPQSTDPQVSPSFPSSLANREPNGSYSYFGLLSSITYPTKGSDSLVYEPNTVWETRSQYSSTFVNKNATGTGLSTEVDVTFPFNIYTEQNITLNMSCPYSGTGTNDHIHQHLIVSILNSSGVQIYNHLIPVDSTFNQVIDMPTGNYTLKLAAYGAAAAGAVTMFYKVALPPVTANYQVGGVRLLKNISTPLIGATLIKKYVYAALTSQTQSSGRVRYDSNASDYYTLLVDGKACPDLSIGQCTYFVGYSTPLHSLNYYSGNLIHYNNVIELKGEQWANGGVEHQYAQPGFGSDALLVKSRYIPGVPLSNGGWTMGLETLKQTFFTTGGVEGSHTYTVVNKVATHFVTDTRLMKFADNYVVRKDWEPTQTSTPPLPSQFDPYDVMYYSITAQWIYPDTVTTTNYDLAGNNPVVTKQYDVYNNPNNLLVSERHTIGSDAIDQKMVFRYPHELVAAGVTVPYQAMVNANHINETVEQTFYKSTTLLQGLMTNYSDFGSGVYEPSSIQTKTTGTYEDRITFTGYNINGGLLSQSKKYGAPISYLWSYNNLFPVAEAKNAASNEIYYEGFEYSTTATAGAAHTGKRYNNVAFTVSFTPPTGSYLISWFQLTSGKWVYHNETYTGSKSFAAGTPVDDIAVYPSDALMSTVNFDPYIGMVAGIDAKGQTTTYEYDGYQRLQNIKDLYGNIIKNYTYNYNTANPTVYYNALQSQAFTKYCTVGVGSSVTYTVNAGGYSSSISQADADAQALAEIADKGQEYADANGTCTTSIQINYYNQTPLSGGLPTGHVTQLQVKNSGGTVLYTFTEAQLTAGVTITPGTYTLAFTTSGPVWTSGSNTGWGAVQVDNSAFTVEYSFTNTGATSYSLPGCVLTSGSPWSITIGTGLAQ